MNEFKEILINNIFEKQKAFDFNYLLLKYNTFNNVLDLKKINFNDNQIEYLKDTVNLILENRKNKYIINQIYINESSKNYKNKLSEIFKIDNNLIIISN